MRVMLLDGQYSHSLPIAAELATDLGAEVIGVAPSKRSHLHRSRYVAEKLIAPLAVSDDYGAHVLDLVSRVRPDVVVPVGYYSFRSLIPLRSKFPESTAFLAPAAHAFAIAEDKVATYDLAAEVGVDHPRSMTDVVTSGDIGQIRFPIFVKARMERGGQSTALVRDAQALRSLDVESLGGDVLFQEYIDAEPYTYAHSGYYEDGVPVAEHQHLELRSVPRRGGSGTRLRTFHDPELRKHANSLMLALRWNGVAQVEFKRRKDGGYALMEINPKFWASYALASRSGARIAATAVARLAGRPLGAVRPTRDLEMVFPVREALHVASNLRTESIAGAVKAILWPPAVWDIEFTDLWANVPLRTRRPHSGRSGL
ncbi:ATP-grasp domain-containing protein [Microbacterium sp.]|uniref:ATP-grasp domain-containing protein n=1 Tax=Microbacterium sp. TaxID=51671 RepID=UPI0028125C48|nr:ATP-grasp domain-containing protein [Microbacterium sp.]